MQAFGGKGMNGIMTFLLTKIVKENRGITYGNLLDRMHDEVEKVIQKKCKPNFLKHFFPQKISQVGVHILLLLILIGITMYEPDVACHNSFKLNHKF